MEFFPTSKQKSAATTTTTTTTLTIITTITITTAATTTAPTTRTTITTINLDVDPPGGVEKKEIINISYTRFFIRTFGMPKP